MCVVLFLVLFALLCLWCHHHRIKSEGYRDPIYLDRGKLWTNYYPRSGGSIYGPYSNVFSGVVWYKAGA